MAWKLKKEWEGKSIDTLNTPLDELTQKQIAGLNESVRNALIQLPASAGAATAKYPFDGLADEANLTITVGT